MVFHFFPLFIRPRFDTLRPMSEMPLDLALREIGETRHLLQGLITSSESFDYRAAKAALKKLDQKVRKLGRIQSRLQGQAASAPNVQAVDFGPLKSAL